MAKTNYSADILSKEDIILVIKEWLAQTRAIQVVTHNELVNNIL